MIATCTFYCVLDQFKMKDENSMSDGGSKRLVRDKLIVL